MSDAGRLITSRQFFAALADSVSTWANVNCVSKLPAGRSLWSWSCRAYATHSSIRMRHGPYSLNSSRSASPGLVAFSSSARTRSNAFLPPSCQASSPQSVRTTVPSDFLIGFPGEILFPTRTTRRAVGTGVVHQTVIFISFEDRQPLYETEETFALAVGVNFRKVFAGVIDERCKNQCAPGGKRHGREPFVEIPNVASLAVLVFLTAPVYRL